MDVTMIISLLSSWITHFFPSLSQYTEFVGPVLMVLMSALGVFTNMLPEPGHVYPVPDVADLETQLQGGFGFILKIAKFTRSLTISVNWFIATAVYSWFYKATNAISTWIPRFGKSKAASTAATPVGKV